MEIKWKDILGYEGLYQVSNYGMVKSLGNSSHPGEHLLALKTDKDGYKQATLCKEGKMKWFRVHRLVWEAFNGPIPEGMQINHINENKGDNRLENLNTMDCKTNINWGTGIERRAAQNRKPVIQLSKDGKEINRFDSVDDAANALGLHHAAISKCCLHRPHAKSHGGFRWEYQ